MSDKATKTDTVTLNMAQTLEIIRQPETKLVADGMKVSFDFEASGDGLTYEWYFRNKGSASFSYTSTFEGNSYTALMNNDRAGRQIYCVVTDAYGNTAQTKTVTLSPKYYDKIIYPDNTAVIYAYDENNNIISVSDWAGRITRYTYDVNNNITGVVKPDGSVTTTVYNDAQQVVSTTEYNSSGIVIVGYEYTYDTLGRVTEEIHLAENTKLCYTYDNLSRVTGRTTVNTTTNETISQETFTYDAAGNIIGDNTETAFVYDTNNRLTSVGGQAVTYDLDGNMLSCGTTEFTYDSENRLLSAGNNTYAYNAEDIRIRNLCGESETTYAYNTNARLSQLLQKTTNGVTTKYVYGVGLIGEETGGIFKTYHFDMRGSTTAITDMSGNVTDTFKYDTYGKLLSRTGTSDVIFLYNGRDGVITEQNGLLYMRTRYYSPVLRRFINADILHGEISDSTSLNRYAYVNGNPVSFVDPFGMAPERGNGKINFDSLYDILKKIKFENDSNAASDMFATALKQILYFKNIFKVSNETSLSIPLSFNSKMNFSVEITSGKGKIEISEIVSNQIDILENISFDISDISISFDNGGIKISYSTNIDKYSAVTAYISEIPYSSYSVGYIITTTDDFSNSVSTSIGISHGNISNNQNKFTATVPIPVPKMQTDTTKEFLLKRANSRVAIGAAALGVSLIAYAIANDPTIIGFVDDVFLIPLGGIICSLGI